MTKPNKTPQKILDAQKIYRATAMGKATATRNRRTEKGIATGRRSEDKRNAVRRARTAYIRNAELEGYLQVT